MGYTLIQQFHSLIEDKYYSVLPYMFDSKDAETKFFLHNQDRYLHTFNLLGKMLSNKPEKLKVLDIGTSPFTFLLKKKFPNLEIWTVDYDNQLQKRCQKFKIKFIKLDLSSPRKTLPKNYFDIVTYSEVIEHLKRGHRNSLKLITDGLKKNGVCIVQTPNRNSLKNFYLKSSFLKKVWNKNTIDLNIPDHFRHYREFSKKELKEAIMSIRKTQIISSSYSLYYDTLASSLVYRKNSQVIKYFLTFYYLLVKFVPFLRASLEIIYVKK